MSDRPHDHPATRVVHAGRDPRRFLGAVNTPVFRATTMLFPTVSDLESAARNEFDGIGYGLHGLPTVTDLQSAVAAIEGGARGARRSFGSHRDHAAAPGARASRRSRPRHRFRLWTDTPLLQQSPDAARCRGHVLRSADRRGDRARVPPQYADRVHRVAGIADLRSAGHFRDRRRRASARRDRHPRQLVGDSVRFSFVRAWRRHLGARRDQVHRRPLRRAAGADPSPTQGRSRRCIASGPTSA